MLFQICLTYVAFVLQSSLVPRLGWGAAAPHLVLAGLVWMVWRSEARQGGIGAAVWGLLADALSGGPVGGGVVVFVLTAWGLQEVRARWRRMTWYQPGVLTGVVVLCVPVAINLLRLASQSEPVEVSKLIIQEVPAVISTALLAILACGMFQALRRRGGEGGGDFTGGVSSRWMDSTG
ncbi:MAG: rod shape-determining protein MreD [Planctomycetales bacterium]